MTTFFKVIITMTSFEILLKKRGRP